MPSRTDHILSRGYRLAGALTGIGQGLAFSCRPLQSVRQTSRVPAHKQRPGRTVWFTFTSPYKHHISQRQASGNSNETHQEQVDRSMGSSTGQTAPPSQEPSPGQKTADSVRDTSAVEDHPCTCCAKHAIVQQWVEQLSADLAMALGRVSTLEDQLATLTASLSQPAGLGTETVPHSPAPNTDTAATYYGHLPAAWPSLRLHTKLPSVASVSETDSPLPRPQRMMRSSSLPSLSSIISVTSPFSFHGPDAAATSKVGFSGPVTAIIFPSDKANASRISSTSRLAPNVTSKEAELSLAQNSPSLAAIIPSQEARSSSLPNSPAPAATFPSKEAHATFVPVPIKEAQASPVGSSPAPAAATSSKDAHTSPDLSSPAPAATFLNKEFQASPVSSSPAPAATHSSKGAYFSRTHSSPMPAAATPSKEAHAHYSLATAATASSSKDADSRPASSAFSVAANSSFSSSRRAQTAPVLDNAAPTRPAPSSPAQNAISKSSAADCDSAHSSSDDAGMPAGDEEGDGRPLSARRSYSQGTSSSQNARNQKVQPGNALIDAADDASWQASCHCWRLPKLPWTKVRMVRHSPDKPHINTPASKQSACCDLIDHIKTAKAMLTLPVKAQEEAPSSSIKEACHSLERSGVHSDRADTASSVSLW